MIKLIKGTFYKEGETKRKLQKFIKVAKKLSFGGECEKFERRFAKWQGRKYCIFVNSGSSANLALLQSLLNLGELKRGDKVGFSAVTWSTNVMPIVQLALTPIPVDVEIDSLNVSSQKLLNVLKKHKLKAIFLTNLLGLCDDIEKIRKICQVRKILLFEDNCESLGSVYGSTRLGNFGYASTFSFYVGHHMSTIEGGAVCTDDEKLATMVRIVRAHGWDRNLSSEKQKEIRTLNNVNSTFYSRYTFYDLGFNLRPTEINGFIGNFQLNFLDSIIEKRQSNFLYMGPKIYAMKDRFFPLKFDHLEVFSNFAVPVICRSKEIRDQLVKLCNRKVEIRPIVGGNMVQQPFASKYLKGFYSRNPNARLIHENGLYFGNNPDLTVEEMDRIIGIFTRRK